MTADRAHDAEVVAKIAAAVWLEIKTTEPMARKIACVALGALDALPAAARERLARRLCPEIAGLVDAAWQVLDDMGVEGTSCCLMAKAQLRHAMEPFYTPDDDNPPLDMPLSEAKRILRECGFLAAAEPDDAR